MMKCKSDIFCDMGFSFSGTGGFRQSWNSSMEVSHCSSLNILLSSDLHMYIKKHPKGPVTETIRKKNEKFR